MATELSKEEMLQEALIGWLLAGGNCEDLVRQLKVFIEGLMEVDRMDDGGIRQAHLHNLMSSFCHSQWLAGKVDRAGIPELPPHVKAKAFLAEVSESLAVPAPVRVLVDMYDGIVNRVMTSAPADVVVWDRSEVQEGELLSSHSSGLSVAWPPHEAGGEGV